MIITFLLICAGWVAVLLLPDWIAELKEARLVSLGKKLLLLGMVLHPPMGCRTSRAMSYGKIEPFTIVQASPERVLRACKARNRATRCCFREVYEGCMGEYNGLHTA